MGENCPKSLGETEVAELHWPNVVDRGHLHKHRRPWSDLHHRHKQNSCEKTGLRQQATRHFNAFDRPPLSPLERTRSARVMLAGNCRRMTKSSIPEKAVNI